MIQKKSIAFNKRSNNVKEQTLRRLQLFSVTMDCIHGVFTAWLNRAVVIYVLSKSLMNTTTRHLVQL